MIENIPLSATHKAHSPDPHFPDDGTDDGGNVHKIDDDETGDGRVECPPDPKDDETDNGGDESPAPDSDDRETDDGGEEEEEDEVGE